MCIRDRDSLIPASKISNLTQGMFVGAVADNFDERIEQKIFHAEIVVDDEQVKRETARYVKKMCIRDSFIPYFPVLIGIKR